MHKTIDEIRIIGNEEFFTLNNDKNNASVTINSNSGNITFNDSFGNTIQNYPSIIRINFETFNLTNVGQPVKGI